MQNRYDTPSEIWIVPPIHLIVSSYLGLVPRFLRKISAFAPVYMIYVCIYKYV